MWLATYIAKKATDKQIANFMRFSCNFCLPFLIAHTARINTKAVRPLIVAYIGGRKDKYEMEKQIERAKNLIDNPAKNKKMKFTKSSGEKMELNQKLVEKTLKLLGINGYYTNLPKSVANNQTIIARYRELYCIEQAFRISKSDLQTTPIFHYKEEPIKLHLLICFMALIISKHIELKTETSIKNFILNVKRLQMLG